MAGAEGGGLVGVEGGSAVREAAVGDAQPRRGEELQLGASAATATVTVTVTADFSPRRCER